MKVVILAGGRGTRLGLTDRPKPMVDVAGTPLLERLVENVKLSGFTEFVFLTGHLGDVIEKHFGDGSRLGVTIEYVREAEPVGTAGAVRDARSLLHETFVVLYGDILVDVDFVHLVNFHLGKGGVGTLFVHPNDHPHDSDLVVVDEDARIESFLSKPHEQHSILPNLVSAALYVLEPEAIDYVLDEGSSDWGADVFPEILAGRRSRLYAYRSVEYAKDMGTPTRLAKGVADLASGRTKRLSLRQPKPAVFFDRDGVLNREINGVHRAQDLALLAGATQAVRSVNIAGIPAICVTNQPDIAKGFMTVQDLRRVSAALDTALAGDGAYLDDLFYCPHHPRSGFPGEVVRLKIICACRKPAPGMLVDAAAKHNLDLDRSWLIGDRYADIVAAHRVGVRAVLVKSGHGGDDRADYDDKPDAIADTVLEAVTYVLGVLN